jgi:DNA-binding transcriptional LysR family regulator
MPMLSLRQVEAFLAVAETGSFGAAAGRLGTTQPAISKRIAELEARLGAPLFDREQRPPRLTERGHALRPLCEEMLAVRERMLRGAMDTAAYSGVIRFGVTELVALTFLPALVSELRRHMPRARLRAEVKLAEELQEGLSAGRLDVVVAPGVAVEGMASRRIARVEMAWMCGGQSRDIPPRMPAAALAHYPILAQTQSSGLQAVANRWLQENGVRVRLELASNSLSALCGLTMAGMGIALLPRRHFAGRIQAGELRVIETDPAVPPLDYHLCYPRTGFEALARIVSDAVEATVRF